MRNLECYRVIYAKDLKPGDRFINGVCLMNVVNQWKFLSEKIPHLGEWENEQFGRPIFVLCAWNSDKTDPFVGGCEDIQLCEFLPVLALTEEENKSETLRISKAWPTILP
jgi:hypothetical protein